MYLSTLARFFSTVLFSQQKSLNMSFQADQHVIRIYYILYFKETFYIVVLFYALFLGYCTNFFCPINTFVMFLRLAYFLFI